MRLQSNRHFEIGTASAVRADDHIGELAGSTAESTPSTYDGHWTGFGVGAVGDDRRTIVQKVEPGGEERGSRAGENLRQSGSHGPAFHPAADTARLIGIVGLVSGQERAGTRDSPVGEEGVATPKVLKGNPTIEAPRSTVDRHVPLDWAAAVLAVVAPVVRTGSLRRSAIRTWTECREREPAPGPQRPDLQQPLKAPHACDFELLISRPSSFRPKCDDRQSLTVAVMSPPKIDSYSPRREIRLGTRKRKRTTVNSSVRIATAVEAEWG